MGRKEKGKDSRTIFGIFSSVPPESLAAVFDSSLSDFRNSSMSRTFQESIYVSLRREREARGPCRGIRANWLRRKDFVEFELGTKCRDEIPDTASANIDSPLVLNSERREQCAAPGRAGPGRAGVFERAA